MPYELMIEDHFDAAHHLNAYEGPCSRTHGHRFLVQVTVSGENLDKLGMLVDFKDIKHWVEDVLQNYDHQYLNKFEGYQPDSSVINPYQFSNPTAENISRNIYSYLETLILQVNAVKGLSLHLVKVAVWESPNACCSYWRT